jgi:hypothetical protein
MFTFPELLVPAYVVPFGLSDTDQAGHIQHLEKSCIRILESIQLTRLSALHCRTVIAFMTPDYGIRLEIPKPRRTIEAIVQRELSIR